MQIFNNNLISIKHRQLFIMKKTSFLRQLLTYSLMLMGSLSLQAQVNVTLGPGAGTALTTGEFNSLFGHNAGHAITAQHNNTMFGTHAGMHSTGTGNTFLGSLSGRENTFGSNNVFVGKYAGRANLLGNENTFIGTYAGEFNLTGYSNTFLGFQAGSDNEEGAYNTFLGHSAGKDNEDGFHNTFVGSASGQKNTTGTGNAMFGRLAGWSNTSGINNTFLGKQSGEKNSRGDHNTFVGESSGPNNTLGNGNTFVGKGTGFLNSGGNFNTYLGYLAAGAGNATNATAIGYRAVVSTDNSMVLGSIIGVNKATSSTNVGIGTPAPSFRLHLAENSAAKPGSSHWTIFSDRRLKKEIVPFTDGISVLQQINPVRYQYNGKADTPEGEEFVGIIAQDVQRVVPYMVGETEYQNARGSKENYLNFDANAFTYLLINSVKELNNSMEELYIHHEELMHELSSMRMKYDSLFQSIQTPQISSRSSSKFSPDQGSLFQNIPNPTQGYTNIPFMIPSHVKGAYLRIMTPQGQAVKDLPIQQRGKGQIKLQTSDFSSGTYIYQLILDGKILDSKRMIVSN